jgi:hypothetical protein
LSFLITIYIIVEKSGLIDVIPLSSKIKLFSEISLYRVSKLTILHDVPAINNSFPVASCIRFCKSKACDISVFLSSVPSPMEQIKVMPVSPN